MIGTSEAVLCASLSIEALVPLVEGVTKMVLPPMRSQVIKFTGLRENRRCDGGDDDGYQAQCFHHGHWGHSSDRQLTDSDIRRY
jgi:hypothetical protein